MKNLSWVNHPAMRNIDARKMRVIVNLLNEVEGQPIEASIPCIMRANQELQRQGLAFTPQEQSVIMDIITSDLPPSQKSRVDMIKSMMNFPKK